MIRVLKFRLVNVEDSIREQWREIAIQCQEIVNLIWQTWLLWHVQHGSRQLLREYMREASAFHDAHKRLDQEAGELLRDRSPAARKRLAEIKREKKQLKKPKFPTQSVCKELSKLIYDTISKEYPDLLGRPWGLLQHRIVKNIKDRKDANGHVSAWISILLCRESVPSTTKPVPIPFDRRNCSIAPGRTGDENYRLTLRLRKDASGTRGEPQTVEMLTNSRKCRGLTAILKRLDLFGGDYKFCGSSIVFDRGKLYAHIHCEEPEASVEPLDAGRVAVLRPAVRNPWKLRLPRRNRRPGGSGRYVAAMRTRLLTGRWDRQENYRWAGSATKGHGRRRALLPLDKFQQKWKRFVKSCNHAVTTDVVRQCVEHNCGRLYLALPADRDSRFLATAGKVPGRRDSTGWDWYQVESLLSRKCQQAGIALEVRKRDSQEKPDSGQKSVLRKTGRKGRRQSA